MFNMLLAILSGVVTGLSFDIPHLSFLIWFSFVPLVYILFKVKKSAVYFFLAGLFNYLVVMFWLGFVTRLGASFLIVYLALYWLVFAYLGKFLVRTKLVVITLPALWVALEFLGEYAAGGCGWAILGYSQFKNIFFIQAADILGVHFISFVIITINVIIFKVMREKRLLTNKVLYAVILLAVCVGYSAYRLRVLKADSYLNVSVVQPNIPQELKWNKSYYRYILNKLGKLGKKINSDSLVIYPESSWPELLDTAALADLSKWVKGLGKDVLIGAVTEKGSNFYNALCLLIRMDATLAFTVKLNWFLLGSMFLSGSG